MEAPVTMLIVVPTVLVVVPTVAAVVPTMLVAVPTVVAVVPTVVAVVPTIVAVVPTVVAVVPTAVAVVPTVLTRVRRGPVASGVIVAMPVVPALTIVVICSMLNGGAVGPIVPANVVVVPS